MVGGLGRRGRVLPKIVGGVVALQVLAAASVVVARSGSPRVTALVRAAPAPLLADAPPSTEPVPTSAPVPSSVVSTTTSVRPRPAATPAPPSGPTARLQARLDAALAGLPQGCLVVRTAAGELYARAPDEPVAPASTQKLLVAAAALSRLGADFRFVTTVVAPAPPHDGTVDGLWLVGSGDPLLATPEYAAHLAAEPRTRGTPPTSLSALADDLVAQGVRSVRGPVHADDSRYDRTRWLPTWKPAYRDEADVGPLGALTVNGGLDSWSPQEQVTSDPAAHAAGELVRILNGKGVAASGVDNAPAAGGVVLGRVQSAPLGEIVSSMLRSSDNLAAELLVRELDRQSGGSGTTGGGTRLVLDEAGRLGLPTAGLRMVDGSGLSSENRSTCPALLGALELGDRPGFGAITDGLAIAGRTGTLATRYGGTNVSGRLAAKTGWIDCAMGMVGRLPVSQPLRFAFLGNGVCAWPAAKGYEDRVVGALATFPEGG